MSHTLLSSSLFAWRVASPEQQTKADELESPALFIKKNKQNKDLVSIVIISINNNTTTTNKNSI